MKIKNDNLRKPDKIIGFVIKGSGYLFHLKIWKHALPSFDVIVWRGKYQDW